MIKKAWSWLRHVELSLLFVKLLSLVGALTSLTGLVLYILITVFDMTPLKPSMDKLGSQSLALYSALFAVIGLLYTRQRASLNRIEKSINATKADLRSVVAKMDLRVRSGSVFSHSSVIGDNTRLIEEFSLRKHDSSAYLSMHSEVLYYSTLCSLLEHWKSEITKIWRAHAFFPDTPTAMFLPELLDIVSELPTECHAYLFRNDVLDYDRQAMHDPSRQHLWPTFVKASRALFRDQGAQYGFLEPKSPSQSIWYGRPVFRRKFEENYERILIELRDGNAIACVVDRDLGTSRFRSASLAASGGGGDPVILKTREYFEELLKEGQWHTANDWDNHGLEVAIVSGEEMEVHAGPFVTLWAVDDFPTESSAGMPSAVQDPDNSWQAPGSSRDIAWRKTVVAALKGSTINRVFLVDAKIFDRSDDLISLFVTMAVQHRFLNNDSRGQVRLLVKNENHKKAARDRFFPDLAIMVRSPDDVLGGVIVHPAPEYIRSGRKPGKDWLTHVKSMWQDAEAAGQFPRCFEPGLALLTNHETDIICRIAEREEHDQGTADVEGRKLELGEWFASEVKQILTS